MKFFLTVIIIFSSFYFLTSANLVFAQTPLEKAIENVRGKLDDLVSAKDEDNVNDLALRIETFKKVIDLSISEAKDLKLKLLAIDQIDKELVDWRETMVGELNQALGYYNEQKDFLADNGKNIDLVTIKSLARDFKTWRDENYLGVAEQIYDFLLVQQEQKSVQIAKRRLQRISDDVRRLEKLKIRGVDDLVKLLDKADILIQEGVKINDAAFGFFLDRFILPQINSSSTEDISASSTLDIQIPTSTTSSIPSISVASSSSSTSSGLNSTTTLSGQNGTSTAVIFQPSIKDLVRDSLNKLKEAYQIFIEMSNLVRELLK